MRLAALIFGTVLCLLGALRLLQVVGLVTIEPILCLADCAPVEGLAPAWIVAGVVALALGFLAAGYGIRPRHGRK
ncbi:hypothetical protein FIU93_08020 [Labrenzia sp. THAF35]|uniref:hypothetical protein n=1 Tax=Labrenzia sp. THAF35 TaxID=2587854 RepID=UPI0012692CBA|nr:hypothetical protein [Labrenzia sp. THAF35]QFT66721.1 hypothetical protein FIU93_08020 [Labrenzia sp. THAF35]